jgi:predicted homoserine dehydrogenase-like protein
MNLMPKLAARSTPVRASLIGAGKFGAMFLSQVPHIPNLEVVAIADLDPEKAKATCRTVGWDEARIARTTFLTSGVALTALPQTEVVIEATGHPSVGITHALAAIENKKHIIMVNVEADVLAGLKLSQLADKAGVVYSMAYGDQPALIAEMVDWGRSCGLEIVAAGKGTKYLPLYHAVTPDEVWTHYGLTPAQAKLAGMNSKMFNSFLDGTKSALEMAAVANACDLNVPEDGLQFPPVGVDDLPHVMRPIALGGHLPREGMVEVISSLERDSRPVYRDLRWGVYVVFKAPNLYAAQCFKQYGLLTDETGLYAALYRPYHLIGLELSVSVLNAALRHEPTGQTRFFKGDVVATAKRDLERGEMLDGEGGFCVYGKLIPAQKSLQMQGLPIGLAQNIKLKRAIKAGESLTYHDVEIDFSDKIVAFRRSFEEDMREQA